MNFIIELIELVKGVFQVILAIPIFGPLLLIGAIVPFIVKAMRRR